jgi:peptide/nickel transport system substrate-binding protein
MRRSLAAGAAGAALVLAVVAGGLYGHYLATTRAMPAAGGTYTEALVGLPEFLNPILASDDNARDIDALLFQGLTRTDSNDIVHPVLAQSWETPDNQSYTFHLRHGVRWSDGKPFTADDVVFTIAVIQSPAYNDPVLSATWKAVSVTRVDDYTVRFDLKAPSTPFLINTSLGIIPAHVFGKPDIDTVYASRFNSEPVGTGPYAISGRDRSSITLTPNPFARRRPLLDHLVFRIYATRSQALDALRRAEVDAFAGLTPAEVRSLQQVAGIRVHTSQTFQNVELLMNQRQSVPFFQDLNVRAAVAFAIDRRAILNGVLDGQALRSDGPLPPSVWVYARKLPPYYLDRRKAEGLLDEAGWTPSAGGRVRQKAGKPLQVSLVASSTYPYLQVAQVIASNLDAAGFSVKLQSVSTEQLVADYLTPRNFDLALTAWDNGPDPDIFSLWDSTQEGPDGFNFSGMNEDVGLNKDLEDGQKADRGAREAAYQDAQTLLVQDLPAVWLYEPLYSVAVNDRVQGFLLDPALEPPDRYAHVTDWYVNTRRN